MSFMHGVCCGVMGELGLSASSSSSSTMCLGELDGDKLLGNLLKSCLGDMAVEVPNISSFSADLLGDFGVHSLVLTIVMDSFVNPVSMYSMTSDIGEGVAFSLYLL